MVGTCGSAGARSSEVTASGRSRPSLIIGSAVAIGSNWKLV